MGGIQQFDPLDGPHGSGSHCWIRNGDHLHAGMELPFGLLPELVSHAFILFHCHLSVVLLLTATIVPHPHSLQTQYSDP